jgi:hypothetical protein
MSNFRRFILASAAICTLCPAVAVAQGDNFYSRNKYQAVTDRAQPDFDPEPVRLGAFVARSSLDAGVSFTDNVFASPTNKQSDVIARIGAQVSATTDWSVHAVGFDAAAYRNEYLDISDESNNELRGRLRGRLDVTREWSLGGAVFAEQRTEARTDFVNAVGLDRPVRVDRIGASIDANYQSDRVRWQNNATVLGEDYKNGRQIGTGNIIDQDFRDRTVLSGRSRLSYALTPNVAVFGQGTVEESRYDKTGLIGGQPRKRDSRGYTAALGVDFELDALVRGDIAIGYLNEDRKDPFFEDVTGLSVDATMRWFPTQLTTVTFNAGRRVVDLGAFDSPSAVDTRGGVRVDHELLRNVILSGFVNTGVSDYTEIDREDRTTEFGAIATYKMNKRVHWEAFARRFDRDTSGSNFANAFDYEVTIAGIGLRLFP